MNFSTKDVINMISVLGMSQQNEEKAFNMKNNLKENLLRIHKFA